MPRALAIAVLVVASLLAPLPAAAGAPGDLPWPYRPGARWEYELKVPVVGPVGRAVRTMLPDGRMKVELDLRLGESRSGHVVYRLAAHRGVLEVVEADFTPRDKGAEAWTAAIAPGLPLFPTADCPRPVDQVVRLKVVEGPRTTEAQSRMRTVAQGGEANGYGDLHHVVVEGDDLGRFPSKAEYWASDESGIVKSRVRVGAGVTVTWDLVSFRPAPR